MSVETGPAKRYRGRRIMNGVLSHVILEKNKVVEVLGPVKKDPPLEQEQPNLETVEKKPIGIQLVPEEDTGTSSRTKPMDISQEQKSESSITLTPISMAEIGKIFTQYQDGDTTKTNESKSTQILPEPIKVPEPIPVPEPEPPKPSQIPKITIPKVQISIPQDQPAPIQLDITTNKLGAILNNTGTYTSTHPKIGGAGTYQNYQNHQNHQNYYQKPKETKVVGTDIQKADEKIISQHQQTDIQKSKERKRPMSEELDAELLTERKFEEWVRKQKFRENLEKAAKFAEETRDQFEEKIPELSNKIEGITGEVKGVEDRLDTVDKSVGDVNKSVGNLCTGIDCIKTDVKKYQESQEELEKMVQERFRELGEKVQSLERPIFTCESCGEQAIAPLSSYCPNCGAPIHSWSDESGEPVRGWTPYWKRIGKNAPQ